MRKWSAYIIITLLVLCSISPAQNSSSKTSIEIPVVEAKAEDVGSIDGIIKAFYSVISGKIGEPRQWSRDKTLYVPDIRFISIANRGGKISVTRMNHQQYVESSNDFFVNEGFIEREIHRVVRKYQNTAHVFSTYEYTTSGQRKTSGRGVNSLELYFDGNRWWISAVTWEEESPDNLIPKEFLP